MISRIENGIGIVPISSIPIPTNTLYQLKLKNKPSKFWKHIKASDPNFYCFKALESQEMSKNSTSWQRGLRLTQTNTTNKHNQTNVTNNQQQVYATLTQTIWLNQTVNKERENYLTYWTETTKRQNKLQCYVALNREYTVANYLSTVSDAKQRETLPRYRLSSLQPGHCRNRVALLK